MGSENNGNQTPLPLGMTAAFDRGLSMEELLPMSHS
jgi:hypothetical protein